MKMVTIRRKSSLPLLVEAMVDTEVLSKAVAERILEQHRADIATALEDGRNEVIDIIETLSPRLRKGDLPEDL